MVVWCWQLYLHIHIQMVISIEFCLLFSFSPFSHLHFSIEQSLPIQHYPTHSLYIHYLICLLTSLFIKFIIYDQIAENLIHFWHIFKWTTANLRDSFHRPIVYWPLNLIVKSNLIWMKCACVRVLNNIIDDLSNYYLPLIFTIFNL